MLFVGNSKDFMKKLLELNELAKLEDIRSPCKNQLNFYTLIVNNLKM